MSDKQRVVIALGGNALQSKYSDPTAQDQLAVVKNTCHHIAAMSHQEYDLTIVHGNGPQVGRILLASETARNITPPMPLDVCGAMSQGYIGYHIQQSLRYALSTYNKSISVVSIITQVVIEASDPAFSNPLKPIGPFYSKEEAQNSKEEKGYVMQEDAGRGWRRVVASPLPTKIVEINTIRKLCNDTIVITCGGGGIPVIENQDGTLTGVDAVIDKDLSAELLAEEISADILMILTEVEKVAINFNTTQQKDLNHMTLLQAEKFIEEGQFAAGSMLPKVQAAMKFVRWNPKKKSIITSLDKANDALQGYTGTLITFS